METDEKKTIALFQRNLETLRKIAGWTTEELAEKIGVNRQTIRNLELAGKEGRDGKPEMTKLQYIGLRSVFDCEASNNELLMQVMPILMEPEESEEKRADNEEKVLTVAQAKAGGASNAAIMNVLTALFPVVGVVAGAVGATWLHELLKDKK